MTHNVMWFAKELLFGVLRQIYKDPVNIGYTSLRVGFGNDKVIRLQLSQHPRSPLGLNRRYHIAPSLKHYL